MFHLILKPARNSITLRGIDGIQAICRSMNRFDVGRECSWHPLWPVQSPHWKAALILRYFYGDDHTQVAWDIEDFPLLPGQHEIFGRILIDFG